MSTDISFITHWDPPHQRKTHRIQQVRLHMIVMVLVGKVTGGCQVHHHKRRNIIL